MLFASRIVAGHTVTILFGTLGSVVLDFVQRITIINRLNRWADWSHALAGFERLEN